MILVLKLLYIFTVDLLECYAVLLVVLYVDSVKYKYLFYPLDFSNLSFVFKQI